MTNFSDWERESWEQRAAAYAAALGDLTRGSIPALLDAVHCDVATRLIDVGTGPGYVALAARERGARVTAVDQSAQMARIARDAGLEVVTAPADALPFDAATHDAGTASYLLNHLADPAAAVNEFGRVLRPGGRFAATIWDVPGANAVTGLVGVVTSELGITAHVPDGPDSTFLADDERARALLAGWADVDVTRLRWVVRVEPGAWFDALAAGTPRTGAALAQADAATRAEARERYVQLAHERYGDGGLVALPACAVLISGVRPEAR